MNKVVLCLVCFMFSCIDEIPFSRTSGNLEDIVIDGFITDQQEPYRVRLSRAVRVTTLQNNFRPVEKAEVKIEDDTGLVVQLNETSPGIYQTDTAQMRGEVGRSYRLNVRTADNSTYQSTWQKMLPVVKMDTLFFEVEDYVETFTNLNGSTVEIDRNRLKMLAGINTTGSDAGFYRVKTRQIEEILTSTLACCSQCWVIFEFPDVNIILVDGTRFRGQQLVNVGTVSYTQLSEYFIEVELLSLSQEAFDFWNVVKEQRSINGSIFDPLPSTLRGNIEKIGSDEVVTGFFSASASTKRSMIIDRSNISPPPKAGVTLREGDCRAISGATTEKPDVFN